MRSLTSMKKSMEQMKMKLTKMRFQLLVEMVQSLKEIPKKLIKNLWKRKKPSKKKSTSAPVSAI